MTTTGLIFDFFEVFGEYLPTDAMIVDVLSNRITDEAKHQFCRVSNYHCALLEIECRNELPPEIPGNKLTIERIELDLNKPHGYQASNGIYNGAQLRETDDIPICAELVSSGGG